MYFSIQNILLKNNIRKDIINKLFLDMLPKEIKIDYYKNDELALRNFEIFLK